MRWANWYYGVEDTIGRRVHSTHPLEQTEQLKNRRPEIGVVFRNYNGDASLEYEVVPLATSEVQSCPLPWIDGETETPGQKATRAQWEFYTGEEGIVLYAQPKWHRKRWTDAQHLAFTDYMAEIRSDTTRAYGVVIKPEDADRRRDPITGYLKKRAGAFKPADGDGIVPPVKKKKEKKKKPKTPAPPPAPVRKERRIRPPRQLNDQAFCRDCVGVPATMKLDTGLYQCDECDELFSHDPQRWTHIKGW